MTKRTSAVVADAGPIIHLDELGSLDLLDDFSVVYVPDAVWKEVEHHRKSALKQPRANIARIQAGPALDSRLVRLASSLALARGEVEALQVLATRKDCIFLTDDSAARLAASQIGYRVHGTIGVLLRSARRGVRTADQVIDLLKAIPSRSTLHIRTDLLSKAIDDLKRTFK